MSIIKSIKQVLGLGPAAENHHWDGSVPNILSLKRGTPEAPGATVLGITSAGAVDTPLGIYPRSYSASGGISSEIGTINDGSWTGTWSRVGAVITFSFSIVITNAGTGGGALFLLSFPRDYLTVQQAAIGICRTTSGLGGQVNIAGTNLALFKMDNTTAIANGTIVGSITYLVG